VSCTTGQVLGLAGLLLLVAVGKVLSGTDGVTKGVVGGWGDGSPCTDT
jgi:hypothetical protein